MDDFGEPMTTWKVGKYPQMSLFAADHEVRTNHRSPWVGFWTGSTRGVLRSAIETGLQPTFDSTNLMNSLRSSSSSGNVGSLALNVMGCSRYRRGSRRGAFLAALYGWTFTRLKILLTRIGFLGDNAHIPLQDLC